MAYYSESEGKFLSVEDMDTYHLVGARKKLVQRIEEHQRRERYGSYQMKGWEQKAVLAGLLAQLDAVEQELEKRNLDNIRRIRKTWANAPSDYRCNGEEAQQLLKDLKFLLHTLDDRAAEELCFIMRGGQ